MAQREEIIRKAIYVCDIDLQEMRNNLQLYLLLVGRLSTVVSVVILLFAPVNPTFLPRYEDEREMCSRTIYLQISIKRLLKHMSNSFLSIFVQRLLGDYHHSTRIAFVEFVMFYLEEVKGRVDYQGYIYPRRRGQVPDSESQLSTSQLEWNGVMKSVSSTAHWLE
ncbi:hypothetical protein ACET3Z_002398 [Daucus carota]